MDAQEAQVSTDIPLGRVAGESDGGERFEMDRTGPIKIIIVNFDPELNHPQHAEVWTPLKGVVEAALGLKEGQAREDLWQHFDHTTTVDSIKEAVEGVKRVAGEFSGDIIGIVSSSNCNRLAFFHGEQSNSFKPVTDTFRQLPGGKVVAVVTQDYVKEGAEMMWRSADVTLGMEMQVQSSAMTGDRGLVLSWYKRPYTVHGRALTAFILGMSHGPEDQAFPLPPPPPPNCTDKEGDVGDTSHLPRHVFPSAFDIVTRVVPSCLFSIFSYLFWSVFSIFSYVIWSVFSILSYLYWSVFTNAYDNAARFTRYLWRFLLSSRTEKKKSIRKGIQHILRFLKFVLVHEISRIFSPLISYLTWMCSTTRAYVLQLISHWWRRLAPCQQTRFHLVYRTDTFNREVKPQVDQFVNSCLTGTGARMSASVATNVECPIQKSHLPSRESLQRWISDSEGFRNVAVLFTAADAYYENPSQLDDDISVFLESGFKHGIICAMFDAGFLDDPEDMDRIRSVRLEQRVTVPGGPVSLVSWYSRPANAIARELFRTGVVPPPEN